MPQPAATRGQAHSSHETKSTVVIAGVRKEGGVTVEYGFARLQAKLQRRREFRPATRGNMTSTPRNTRECGQMTNTRSLPTGAEEQLESDTVLIVQRESGTAQKKWLR
jgi:hypothetical protein